ncbi:uncharacterized protein PAC_08475 [Phialocephala subalpina]|uniref:Uncharacterized protein n=1 Tax=Phialocephala subalpina TaxID=576137 RepID=A0A1L7X0M9_9HELO|nr:uncharacterized protein PAC_08475 [Phialocephala subalpina]
MADSNSSRSSSAMDEQLKRYWLHMGDEDQISTADSARMEYGTSQTLGYVAFVPSIIAILFGEALPWWSQSSKSAKMLLALVTIFFILGFGTAILGSTDPKNAQTMSRGVAFAANDQESLEEGRKSLLTRAQSEEKHEAGSWQSVAFDEFRSTLLAKERDSKKFPCIYSTPRKASEPTTTNTSSSNLTTALNHDMSRLSDQQCEHI